MSGLSPFVLLAGLYAARTQNTKYLFVWLCVFTCLVVLGVVLVIMFFFTLAFLTSTVACTPPLSLRVRIGCG